jgi:VanZ family protein
MRTFLVYHLPAIAYAGLIIALSTLTNVTLPRTQFVELDKVIHFAEYAVFGFLVWRSFCRAHKSVGPIDAAFLGVAFVTLFALTDELYQSYVPNRKADIADFYTDVVGAAVAIAVCVVVRFRTQRVIA